MPRVHLLGTGSAVSDPHRTTTMLAIEDSGRCFLIDCGGDVIQRALLSGLDLQGIDGLLITHEHPDHLSGFPLFMERIWLAGRDRPIDIYGIQPAIDQAQRVLSAFDVGDWDLPHINWHQVAATQLAPVLETKDWRITSSPGTHSVPVIGFRLDHLPSGRSVVYSADTEPCESIGRLANRCDLLIHEATGSGPGHTSVEEAIALAQAASVGQVVLVHLSAGTSQTDLAPLARPGLDVSFGTELGVLGF